MSCPFDLEEIDTESIEPFTGKLEELPEKVKDCAESVKEDQDVSKSQAIAICRDQLDMAGDCPDGQYEVDGECKDIEDVDAPPSTLKNSVYQLASLESEPIEREELGEDKVAYRNLLILKSGTWTDSASRETVWYSPRGLENMELTDDNAVNIMHDDDNDVSKAGHLENLQAEDGSLYADVVIDKSNSAGSYADENLQQTLKTQGANGFGGPSVEIPPQGQEMEYNDEKGMRELVKGKIDGLGLVRNPASKPTSFARQSATRAVALSDDSQEVMVLSSELNDMTTQKILEAVDPKELAGPQEVEEEAQSISDELDVPVDEVLEVLDPLFDMGEEEEVENQEDEEEPEEPEEEAPEEEPEEEEPEEMDMETKVQSLEERLQNLEDMMEQAMAAEDVQEELEEFEQDLADADTVQELSEAKEDLEKRLSELEDKPDYKTLSDGEDSEEGIDGNVTFSSERDHVRGTFSR